MIIHKFFVHHFGSIGNDPYAKSSHLKLDHINDAHRLRWPDFQSQMGYFIGYNGIIFPDGTLIQTRLIGEETAAVKGWNTGTVSFCLAGNFNTEYPTFEQEMKLKALIQAFLDKEPARLGLKLAPETEIMVGPYDFLPHRAKQQTDCYGRLLTDTWARDMALKYLGEKLSLLMRLADLWKQLLGLKQKLGAKNHSCMDSDNRG